MADEMKKATATAIPDADRAAPRAGFASKDIFLAGMNPKPASHPLAAARADLAEAEAAFRQAAFAFQRELSTSVRLEKVESGWECGKAGCMGAMEMRDGNMRCAVCGRTCAANDSSLKYRAHPAQTIFADEGAAARIRAKRKVMERAELARDAARRKLVEGGNAETLELMAEAGRQRHRQ